MKAKIYVSGGNGRYVTVESDNLSTGERETTEYFVPTSGGYVRINNSQMQQVCDGLSGAGNTLRYTGAPDRFVDFIRREYRRGRQAEQREIDRND